MGKPNLSKIGAVTAGKTRTTGISPFSELEISKVYPNPDQPRKQFNDIEELAATIKEHGLLQPITVLKKDDGYMIIAGERRYKAHLHNEAKTIKAYIVDVSEEQVEELTLIENIQRNDLTDFEIAKHICKLWDSGRYEKKSDLATKIGKSDSYVSKSFNCLKLDSEIIDHIEQNKTPISIGVMDEIARVKDKSTQKEVFEKYNNKEITRDEIKDFKPKKTIKEKVEELFINPPISCSYVEENFPRENESINIKKFFDLFTHKEYIERYGFRNANQISFARSLKIGDKVICDFRRFTETAEIKEKSNMEAIVLEIGNWYYIRVLFEDGTEHNIQVYDIIFLNGKKVDPYCFDEIIYSNQKNEIDILTAKIKELEKEIEELNNKEVYIVSHRQKKGTAAGGGFRCRALHEHEAIEIAKQSKYKDLANDKNIIWEARTLKSHCNVSSLSDYIGYGFGTVNDIGTYIAVCDGDFGGTITFEKGGEFVKTTHNREYKVIIKEIDTPVEKPKEIKEPKKATKSLKDEKEIALLELFGDFVTINYTDYDIDMGIDYKQAKKIIDESKQDSIPFNVFNGTDERAYRLIDEDVRTVKDNHIVLIPPS